MPKEKHPGVAYVRFRRKALKLIQSQPKNFNARMEAIGEEWQKMNKGWSNEEFDAHLMLCRQCRNTINRQMEAEEEAMRNRREGATTSHERQAKVGA